ncbi:MAG TPA: CehA/McbA family metallohydrolase [Dehalococcoidia bacterium]|nr:CehA/McbA family metallohydrolase [Dehalococcoidia bacterium]
MLIDLHCHTRPLSACSSLQPVELARLARAADLDAVCLTEHDRLRPFEELQALSKEHGVLLLRGMEVTTELGHVLVFGLDSLPPDCFLAASLRRHVDEAGGLMLLAHPARPGQPAVDQRTAATLFDAVEGINGSDSAAQNAAATRLGASLVLPPTGGSDCHSPREVGTAATQLERPVTSESGLVEELRRGRHRAIDLRRFSGK